jgi:hypothetical protein
MFLGSLESCWCPHAFYAYRNRTICVDPTAHAFYAYRNHTICVDLTAHAFYAYRNRTICVDPTAHACYAYRNHTICVDLTAHAFYAYRKITICVKGMHLRSTPIPFWAISIPNIHSQYYICMLLSRKETIVSSRHAKAGELFEYHNFIYFVSICEYSYGYLPG